jgi:hypothetical protein
LMRRPARRSIGCDRSAMPGSPAGSARSRGIPRGAGESMGNRGASNIRWTTSGGVR